jgi:hypothetical protein
MARPTEHNPDILVTPEMIKAGEQIFYEEMFENDYLDHAPSADVFASIVSKIFCSMLAVYPAALRKLR